MSKQMLKYIETVSKESWVELQGLVQIPKEKDGSRQPITGTSQQVITCQNVCFMQLAVAFTFSPKHLGFHF